MKSARGTRRITRPLVSLALAASVFGISAAEGGAAAAAGVCAKWVATSGSDANAGTETAPYRSINKLVISLAPGQVGCMPANETYYSANSSVDGGYGQAQTGGGTLEAPVVITSGPGGRASFKGQLLLGVATHDITLTGINFTGKTYANGTDYGYKGVHLILNGDRIRVEHNDISDPTGICMQLGDSNQDDPAVAVRVTENLIHGCGMDPAINWVPADSGAHGIYVQNTTGAEIDENWIYGNRTRGVQFYPRNDGVELHHNLFVGNATHVNVGSEGADVAQNSDVHDNLMTDRVTDWAPAKNESQVFGNMPAAGDFNNQIRRNCYDPGDVFWAGNGLEIADDNVGAVPTFVAANRDDYTLTNGSACQGYGPASIQPADFAITDQTVTEGTGNDVIMTFTWNRLVHADASIIPGSASTADYELLDSHLGDLNEQSARVRIFGDALEESTETFTFQLADADGDGAVIGTATGTIIDDDLSSTARPDALVRLAGGNYVGNDVYNVDGTDQTVALTVPQGRSADFDVSLENDGSATDQFTAALAPWSGHPGFADAWTTSGTDVTALLHDGSLNFDDVPAGGARTLTARISPGGTAEVGSVVTYFVHIYHRPIGDPAIKDVVAIKVTVGSPELQPDAAVRPPNGSLVGADVYNPSGGPLQTVRSEVRRTKTVTYRINVGNDGSVPRRLTLRGTALKGGLVDTWKLGGRDVTTGVRDGSLRTKLLDPESSVQLVLTVKATGRAKIGSSKVTKLTARDGDVSDQVKMNTAVKR